MKKVLISAALLLVSAFVQAQSTCYIACYAHENEAFIRVVGLVPVDGYYNRNRICVPTGYAHTDISELQSFKDLCNLSFSECKKAGGCWAGVDTAGGFGH